MSILKTDWHSLLSPTTTVPPDVTFLVEDELEEGGQGGVFRKIGAHRVLLSITTYPLTENIAKGPTDPRIEFISKVLHKF